MSTPTGTPSGVPAGTAPPAPVDPPVKDGSLLGDRIIAGLIVALGAFLLVQAFGFPEPGQPEDPGTAALPRLIGAALVVLGIMLVFNSEKNTFLPDAGSRVRTILIVVAGVAYTFALTPLGFTLSTLIFMVIGLLIMGVRSIVRLVLVPVVVSVAVYYLFTDALGVYLPTGVIEGIMP
ncbi:tripartite tricarboxylate transporter TctB family protein [Corynebacterium sp.]|jgi:putative tricarboxylic transport membrane protein|uniref:tripartite tricarboxylate transporter TctB family protein n=1 Tax=Corynebacterium sp. TaxID=1720 RepID=UPI0025C4ACEC|nr:tripartite tricarboxylate transporter TctB family protein [Corynebacterium sp.]